jgi:hypothetical protein
MMTTYPVTNLLFCLNKMIHLEVEATIFLRIIDTQCWLVFGSEANRVPLDESHSSWRKPKLSMIHDPVFSFSDKDIIFLPKLEKSLRRFGHVLCSSLATWLLLVTLPTTNSCTGTRSTSTGTRSCTFNADLYLFP